MPQAPAVLETSCFVFPLSLHFDVIRVAPRTQETVQESRYKEELETATTAKIPFNPYIMASCAVGNPVSTFRISYKLHILSISSRCFSQLPCCPQQGCTAWRTRRQKDQEGWSAHGEEAWLKQGMTRTAQPFWVSGKEQQGEVRVVVGVQQLPARPRDHWSWSAAPPMGEEAEGEACQGSGFACGVNTFGLGGRTHLSWKGTGRLWCLGCSAELWLWWR